jgi:hypothetical protein
MKFVLTKWYPSEDVPNLVIWTRSILGDSFVRVLHLKGRLRNSVGAKWWIISHTIAESGNLEELIERAAMESLE